jgi:hypothetical protein
MDVLWFDGRFYLRDRSGQLTDPSRPRAIAFDPLSSALASYAA